MEFSNVSLGDNTFGSFHVGNASLSRSAVALSNSTFFYDNGQGSHVQTTEIVKAPLNKELLINNVRYKVNYDITDTFIVRQSITIDSSFIYQDPLITTVQLYKLKWNNNASIIYDQTGVLANKFDNGFRTKAIIVPKLPHLLQSG